ncbi:MAG: nidogen-like domain-containing protein [Bacteroidota bacterium]
MKKIYFLIIVLLTVKFAKSQTIFISEANYQNLKVNGQLNNSVNYKLINEGEVPVQSIKQNHTSQLQISKTASTSCQCLMPIDPTFSVVPFTSGMSPNYRCDDGSSAPISLGFNFCFYGTTYTNCYINNNGNISFGSPYANFSSNAFPDSTFVMIAPFWGDVDTRNLASGLVYYKKTATSLIVKWQNVGYFNSNASKLNDFQLVISNGLDSLVPSGNNVSFCYGDMQWTTGDASMGTNGFGGIPSTVGINKGNGTDYFQIGRFSAPGMGYNGPYNAEDSVDVLDNMHFVFNTCNTGNMAPFTSANVCDTTYVSPFQIVTGEVYAYAPEINQSLTVTHTEQAFKTASNAFSIVSTETVVGGMIIHYQFDASQVAPGSNVVANISGSDSYSTAAAYNRSLYFKVGAVTGITQNEIFEKPFIYPNPASTTLYISNTTENLNIKMYDVYGKILIDNEFKTFENRTLSIDHLANGYYFVKIFNSQGHISTQKIIITH